MMPEVDHVVLYQKAQRDELVRLDLARHRQCGLRNTPHRVRQVVVVQRPELDQLEPGAILITLRTHPCILLVPWEDEAIGLLRPNESLMIVCRRIDQVSEDFFDGPGFRSHLGSGTYLADGSQLRCGFINNTNELVS